MNPDQSCDHKGIIAQVGVVIQSFPGWSVEPMRSAGGSDEPRYHARSIDLCSPEAPQSRPPVPSSAITLGGCRIGTKSWATFMLTQAPPCHTSPGGSGWNPIAVCTGDSK
jgi:hypothetical protein